ncbi:MAG: GAF domain-containing sensor histidine kinase [Chitinophagaceae bacterium]|nr:MAG: GAF domain-containing sensor histidine kinase [Chitinophagaceae bacterium]
MAAAIFKVPVAMLGFVDGHNTWTKFAVGIPATDITDSDAICRQTLISDDGLIIEDISSDNRYRKEQWFQQNGLGFYAAMPLLSADGQPLGTLCLADHKPRIFNTSDRAILHHLSGVVSNQLRLHFKLSNATLKQDRLVSVIAHELKNPLNIIFTATALLDEPGVNAKELTGVKKHIKTAAQKMLSLIDEMLEIGRQHNGNMELNLQEIDLTVLLARTAAANLVLANAKNQVITLDVNELLTIRADEGRLVEIFDNLLSNAIKYSPLGATIAVRGFRAGDTVLVEVQDQGPGFTAYDLENLFQPFTRLTARPTAGEASTGMGLFIVKSLVEAHHATISVRNNSGGQGATVQVSFKN